jgi:hypothetical protein
LFRCRIDRLPNIPAAACLSAAVTVLREEARIVFRYVLLAREYSSAPLLLISLATPAVVIALCFGSLELWFRHQRRESTWLAGEITETLNTRLLPRLPPTPGTGTGRDRTAAAHMQQKSPLL